MAVITSQNIKWSLRAMIPENPALYPPIPGTADFEQRVRGREGDLLVLQVRSEVGLTRARQACFRTLNLNGINSVSLRRSDDPSTWGNIDKIKDFVAVVELGVICYKEALPAGGSDSTAMQYERRMYGSSTRPGELVRDSMGNYFAFESDRNAMLVLWNTSLELKEVLKRFDSVFRHPAPLSEPEASTIGLALSEELPAWAGSDEAYEGGGVAVIEGPTSSLIEHSEGLPHELLFARLAFSGVELTWQGPYQRFEDRESVYSEVGLYSKELDLVSARQFADETGQDDFFRGASCRVAYRKQGILKVVPF